MYTFVRCTAPDCSSLAFGESGFCLAHHPDPERVQGESAARMLAEDPIRDHRVAGIALDGLDLSKRSFYGCCFIGASLRSVLFTNSTFRLCIFDGARLDSCDFSAIDAQFCSFGGADLLNVSFENSELLHCNFDGSRIRECTFNASNLYDSRFIRCEIENTDLEDCDLRRVYLIPSRASNVSYKNSNALEAIRDLEHLYQ